MWRKLETCIKTMLINYPSLIFLIKKHFDRFHLTYVHNFPTIYYVYNFANLRESDPTSSHVINEVEL